MRTVHSSNWFDSNESGRPSLEAFHILIDSHLPAFKGSHDKLQESSVAFNLGDVHPCHCRKAIQELRALKASIVPICQLLQNNTALPVILLALRYQLLDQLHYLEERIDQLIDRIYIFISLCIHPSLNTFSQAKHIGALFQELLELDAAIPVQTHFLFDEARFQEKRLNSISF